MFVSDLVSFDSLFGIFIFIYILFFYLYFFDIIVRLKNRNLMKFSKVYILQSFLTIFICKILKTEGYISSFEVNYLVDDILFLSITLKFKGLKKSPCISFIKRVSKPGFRVYVHSNKIPKIEGGIGLAIFILILIFSL